MALGGLGGTQDSELVTWTDRLEYSASLTIWVSILSNGALSRRVPVQRTSGWCLWTHWTERKEGFGIALQVTSWVIISPHLVSWGTAALGAVKES